MRRRNDQRGRGRSAAHPPSPSERPLAGRVVAITGGARGIGRATATALVREGARVAIGDVDFRIAQATAEEIGALALPLDVTVRESFTAFLDEVEGALGPLEVLINNAGIMPIGPFLDESDQTAERMVAINLLGVITGSKLALARMVPRGSGHLVNVASQAGKAGFPGVASYCATKHAVVGLSEAIRQELRGSGVEVSCVMPAVVNTELTSGLAPASRLLRNLEPQDVAAEIVSTLRRPRFDLYVPRINGPMFTALLVLPRPMREGIGRMLGSDRVMLQADHGVRAAYEERAAGGEPVAGRRD
jgi:NAD(P)-dependent dehydrogenase (short-subunit alcohol dehydrogenase family)